MGGIAKRKVLSRLRTSCSPAPGAPSQQCFNSSSNCQKKEFLNKQSWEAGQLHRPSSPRGHGAHHGKPITAAGTHQTCQMLLLLVSRFPQRNCCPGAASTSHGSCSLPCFVLLQETHSSWFIKPSASPDSGKQAPQLCLAICLMFSLSPTRYPSNTALYRKPFLSN